MKKIQSEICVFCFDHPVQEKTTLWVLPWKMTNSRQFKAMHKSTENLAITLFGTSMHISLTLFVIFSWMNPYGRFLLYRVLIDKCLTHLANFRAAHFEACHVNQVVRQQVFQQVPQVPCPSNNVASMQVSG